MSLGIRALPLPIADARLLAFRPDGAAIAVASHEAAAILSLADGRARPLGLKLRQLDSIAWTDAGLALSDAEAGRTLVVDPEGRVIAETRDARAQAIAVHGTRALLAAPEGV